jgi:hypothetical protein
LYKKKNILQPDDDETEKEEDAGSNSEVDYSYGKDDLESVHSSIAKIDIF